MNKIKFLLRCAISVALIWLVVHKVDWAKSWRVLQQLDFRLALPASLLVLPLIGGLAFRWRIFLRQQGIQLSFRTIFSLTWAGQFFNSVLPGSTGGDVVKIYQLCRLAPDRKAAAAATVVVDRFSALLALLAMAGLALMIDPVPLRVSINAAGSLKSVVLILGGLALIGLAGAYVIYRYIRTTHWLGRLQRTLAALKKNLQFNRNLFAAMLVSFGIHCLNFFIAFLFACSLGISITYFQVLLIFPVMLFLVMIPITVNGHGLREQILIFYFLHQHIVIPGHPDIGVREIVVPFSLLLVSNDLLWSLPGGLWYLLGFKRAHVVLEGDVTH